MAETEGVICPFCKEDGFDKPGLKYHLQKYCDVYYRVCLGNPDGEERGDNG